jgi:C4-dicarboxylate-specific signal transduction histidine kinase
MTDGEGTERRAEALLYELFTNSPTPVAIREVRDGEIVHVEDNPRAAALFDLTPDEVRGRTEAELGVSRQQIERAIARFRAARASGHPVTAELGVETKRGPRVLSGKVLALEDDRGERYLVLLEDVTELRALQAGVERAEQLAALGTLSASIGHEIGNPTMYAQLHLQLAIERAAVEGVSKSILDDMKTALDGVDQIARLLRDMRTLSMSPALATETAEVAPAVQTVADLVGPTLAPHATLHCSCPTVPAVRGSAGRLVQVLLNLVRNAIESVSARQGNVWLVVTQPTPETVEIDVSDDGPGLSPAVRERLFMPFATTKTSGTGLGLYVSQMLVTRAGGTIEAHDREGGGLRMSVVLPVARGA